jgi:hypothetical protein
MSRVSRIAIRWIAPGAALVLLAAAPLARADDPTNEYDFSLTTNHPLSADGTWIGGANIGYYRNWEAGYRTSHLQFNAIRALSRGNSLRFAVIGEWKYEADDVSIETTYIQAGWNVRLGSVGAAKFTNLLRAEYVDEQQTDEPDDQSLRLRELIGVQMPFSRQPYASGTTYGYANGELYYLIDPSYFQRVDARVGIGYVINDLMRLEAGYDARWTRSAPGESMEWALNTWSLTFTAVTDRGVLDRLTDIVGRSTD